MAEENSSKKNWLTYLTLGLSALGIAFFLVQALTLGIVLLTILVSGQAEPIEIIPVALLSWSALLSGSLLLPAFILSLHQLQGKVGPDWLKTRTIRNIVQWVILIWPGVVALGWLIVGSPWAAIFLLGPINILVAGLPVLWVFNTGSRKLTGGSRIRQWRIFGFSLTVMPTLVILVELAAVLVLAVFGGLYLANRMSVDPGLERELTRLIEQIAASAQDVDKILAMLEPYFLQPSVLFLATAVMGGVMPIIEEVVKPIALWPLADREMTPQEGFVGGLLCGAGFALTENILYFTIALTAEDWLFIAIGRAGTVVLHMLASGLVGWGLAKTWRSGKWGAQALLSLGAFLLHGLWNTLALFVGVAPGALLDSEPSFGQTMLFNLPIILLLLISLAGIIWINRYFNKKNGSEFKRLEEISKTEPRIVPPLSIETPEIIDR
jgi:membrane protease YdiL (CAAX protease family)